MRQVLISILLLSFMPACYHEEEEEYDAAPAVDAEVVPTAQPSADDDPELGQVQLPELGYETLAVCYVSTCTASGGTCCGGSGSQSFGNCCERGTFCQGPLNGGAHPQCCGCVYHNALGQDSCADVGWCNTHCGDLDGDHYCETIH